MPPTARRWLLLELIKMSGGWSERKLKLLSLLVPVSIVPVLGTSTNLLPKHSKNVSLEFICRNRSGDLVAQGLHLFVCDIQRREPLITALATEMPARFIVSPMARPAIGLEKLEGLSSVNMLFPLENEIGSPETELEISSVAPLPIIRGPLPDSDATQKCGGAVDRKC